ncbi:hypothetical protein [Stenotrophomonas oahuensis]|uniref:Uncharacterized protein n=1 Tax=Stenotrophomonas oahuensis TaxID=3003271 RepID=A0ABY9YP24_9GAMM|nr:hypothetical protein [Stenotrophomonas sp. A5586]WNH52492.1 hypothetical protein PDM29_19570 [Stenotrophomonas sp. A5586]
MKAKASPRGHEESQQTSGRGGTRRRQRARKSAKACALIIALAAASPTATASGWPVVDIQGIFWKIQQFVSQIKEFTTEAQRWRDTKRHMEQLDAIFDPLRFAMDLPPGAQLEPVAEDYLVKEKCGREALSTGWKQLAGNIAFGDGADWKKRQHELCVSIQRMDNRKFNETLFFLEETMDQVRSEMDRNLESRENSENTSGGAQAAQGDTARLGNQLNAMAQTWSARMQAYDASIASLKEQQRVLAKAALRGDPVKRAVGDVVQVAALEKALKLK